MKMNKIRIYILVAVVLSILITGCDKKTPTERLLFDFESSSDLDRIHWSCHTLFSLSDQYVTHGVRSLKSEFYPPSRYPGFNPVLKQNDWGGYRFFSFDIYNPAEKEVPIVLRIDDRKVANSYADRYNKRLLLKHGVNRMAVPIDSLITSGTKRKMNLDEIYRFIFFSVDPQQKTVLYFDNIRLTNRFPDEDVP